MTFLSTSDSHFADCIGKISLQNPFSRRRVELEREALGESYIEMGFVKAFEPGDARNPNMSALLKRAESVLNSLQVFASKPAAQICEQDRTAAGDLGLFVLYHRYISELAELAQGAAETPKSGKLNAAWFPNFNKDAEQALRLGPLRLRPEEDGPGLLGLFFQMARAFVNIYANFVGRSPAAIALRGSMWESIFTHDLRRYRRTLLSSTGPSASGLMSDIPTLITGPSGTGKELVAHAVGNSGFIPFNVKGAHFNFDSSTLFLPIHLAALSPSLIESELFGHRRGAFTGALEDRASFLEVCAPHGAVFLDEIAEIDATLQVKLLRVLQTRKFSRIGDSETRSFSGRIISATNRELGKEIEAGRFREDLFFRLTADRLVTPSLKELLGGCSVELGHLVKYVAGRLLPSGSGHEAEAKLFEDELCDWIESNLGLDYPWPGNFRELEQCAKAVLIRGRYLPEPRTDKVADGSLAADIHENKLTADELLTRYCGQVFDEIGTYQGTARRLGLDRRTVRARVMAAAKLKP